MNLVYSPRKYSVLGLVFWFMYIELRGLRKKSYVSVFLTACKLILFSNKKELILMKYICTCLFLFEGHQHSIILSK